MFRRIREFFLLADFKRSVLVIVPIVLLVLTGSLMLYWDHEPDSLDVIILAVTLIQLRFFSRRLEY